MASKAMQGQPVHMELDFQELRGAEDWERYVDYVQQVTAISKDESMIPITGSSIREHHLATLALTQIEGHIEFAGYAAITQVYSDRVVELGGLMVNSKFRGQGVAQRLVRKVVARAIEELSPEMILAFSNKNSASIFEKLDGEAVADAGNLPPEVWKLCLSCRHYEEAVIESGMDCCGRVYDITEIEVEIRHE